MRLPRQKPQEWGSGPHSFIFRWKPIFVHRMISTKQPSSILQPSHSLMFRDVGHSYTHLMCLRQDPIPFLLKPSQINGWTKFRNRVRIASTSSKAANSDSNHFFHLNFCTPFLIQVSNKQHQGLGGSSFHRSLGYL